MSHSIGKLFSAIGVGVFIAAATGTAQATAFSYSESASGDLTSTPSTSFAFNDGANTISGTTHFDVNTPGHPHVDSDFDGFAFTLPAHMQLVGISLSFTTTSYNALNADSDLRFCSGVDCGPNLVNLLGTQSVDFLGASPDPINFSFALPPDAGTYSVITSGLGIAPIDSTNGQESWSANYTWTYTVVSIPEPEVLFLFGLGLTMLLVIAYLRKHAR